LTNNSLILKTSERENRSKICSKDVLKYNKKYKINKQIILPLEMEVENSM